ncbi:hypothetical protein [Hafnia paralvei]|uniref:hypothetical protein n=1 Tax=Hafnia paralvei TaxID=546367 RepID=UPI0010338059|nr:hypothetical protein [Hafnia paralvei]TBL64054.1 hypothetical protein EYY97_05375 [Hafnia paralvei]
MSNISNIGDVYHWSIAKIAEAFRLDRKVVKKRLLDGASRMVTLDRDVDLSSGGKATLSLIGLDGTPQSVDIQAQSAANKVIVKRLPEGINTYSVWGLSCPVCVGGYFVVYPFAKEKMELTR